MILVIKYYNKIAGPLRYHINAHASSGIRTWDLTVSLYLNLKHGELYHSSSTTVKGYVRVTVILLGVMKRAVNWMSTASTRVNRGPDRKEQDDWYRPRKVQWSMLTEKSAVVDVDGTFNDQLHNNRCRHQPVEKCRLQFSTGRRRRSTSTATFFLVDGRQPFSSRPLLVDGSNL